MTVSSGGFNSGFTTTLTGGDGFGVGFVTSIVSGGGEPEPTFKPTDLGAAVELWLDAQDALTLFTDVTEATQSTNGANVGRWKDKSGKNRHADKTNVGVNHPVRNDNGINGHRAVNFDTGVTVPGLSSPFVASNPTATQVPGGSQFEVWAVYTSSNAVSYVVTNDNGSFSNYWTIWTNSNAGTFVAGHHMYVTMPNGVSDAGYSTMLGPMVIVRGIMDSTLASNCTAITVNGVSGVSTAGYNPNLNSGTTETRSIFVGADVAGIYPNKGAIGELVYVSRLLTSSEATQMNDYLTNKWS